MPSLKLVVLALISIIALAAIPLLLIPNILNHPPTKSGEGRPQVTDITYDWAFKIDPNKKGEQEGWYTPEYNDSDWIRIDAGVMWEEELGYDYNGWGWYRKWVEIPTDWANHSVVIYIGAADDSAWIYTDGNLSGTHLGEELRDKDPLWWQHPFYIDISKEILPGEPNLIAVKVDDWGGDGGMWKPPIALTIQPPESLIFDRDQFFRSLVASHPGWVWPRWVQYEGTTTASNSHYKAWSIIGVKGHRYEAIVGPDSSIMPNKDSYTITSWLYDHSEGKFYAPENILTLNFSLQQTLISLLEGYLPITQANWTAGKIGVETVHFADDVDGKDIIFTKIELENHGAERKEVSLYIAVRPYGPRIGTVTVYSMAYNSTLNYLAVNGKLGLVLQETPYNWGFYLIEEGDVSVNASQGQLSGYTSCVDLQGFCTGAVEYRFELEPNETINVVLKAPIEKLDVNASVVNQLRAADFDSHLAQVKTGWESLLFSGMKLSLPEEQVVNNFYASLAYLMVLEDGRELHPGPSAYDWFWFRDAAYLVNALDKVGLFNESKPCLDYFIEKQMSDGWFFSQSTEWDSNGEAMWALVQHYQITGNLSWLQEVYPSIRKGALWLQQKRMETKKESDVGTTHYGLLPQGASAEDIGPSNVYHYWDDFWGIAGLKSAIYAANILNETDDLEWLTSEYNDFLNCTLESIKKTMEIRGISHIPCGPDHGFYESWAARGTSVSLWPTYTLNVSDKLVQDSFNYYWSTFFIDGGFVHRDSGNCFWPYVTIGLAHDFMLLGWDDKALSSFRWVLDHPCAPSAWCELQDLSTKLGAPAGSWGDEPHGWACAEYILLVRDMLLMEEESKLMLTPSIDHSWLVGDSIISVEDAPTYFGKVSFTIQSHLANDFINVIISPEQDPPDGYILELPIDIRAAEVNGEPFTNYDKSLLYLPPGSREITIWCETKPPEVGSLRWQPSEPASDDRVLISVNVTDQGCGVETVTLFYSTDSGAAWNSEEMVLSSEDTYEATIGPFRAHTTVQFYVEAYDKAGNKGTSAIQQFTVKISIKMIATIVVIGTAAFGGTVATLYLLKRRKRWPSPRFSSFTGQPNKTK